MRTTTSLCGSSRSLLMAAAACASLMAGSGSALAQSGGDGGGGAPVRVRRPVRPPVIDLERKAQEPRPGQVVPGQPDGGGPASAPQSAAPQGTAPRGTAPNEPAASPQPRPAADTAPATMSMMSTPAPLPAGGVIAAGEPVRASVVATGGPASQVQWRLIDGSGETEWRGLPAGETATGRVEIRTGVGGWVLLEVDGRTRLRINRLSRVRIERSAGAEGSAAGEELLVRLDRGQVEVEPRAVDELGLATTRVRIMTPSTALVRRVGVEVTHDAFNGTREVMLTRE